MSLSGKEIHRSHDEYGVVRVLDDGNKRYLSFGETDEQSCWLKSEPLIPQHEYTRAMMLVLLFCEPKRSLSLGLGSGALNHCLHHHFPELKQDIVELRNEVVKVAYRYFQFPRSKRLSLHVMDAKEYLLSVDSKKVDIIISDIYTEEGLDEQQLHPDYLDACHDRLKTNGWLVLNCWRDHQGENVLRQLKEQFADVRSCTTQSGNWVIYASKQREELSDNGLKQRAKALNQRLGFSFSPFLGKLVDHKAN
jgi:spermidine synthase